MGTKRLKLKKRANGYYFTSWTDDSGGRHEESFGSERKKAYAEYEAFSLRWANDYHTRNPSEAGPISNRELWEKFEQHAKAHYKRRDGTATRESDNFADAFALVLDLFGDEPAREFSARKLQVVQQAMVKADLARNTINARIRRIRHVYRWAAGPHELVAAETWHSLAALMPLQSHRALIIDGKEHTPRETEPVGTVDEAWVDAVCQHAPPTLRAMIQFQWLTGARPQDVCQLRPVDVQTSGEVWVYRPGQHKTAHHGKERIVLIGPKAQEVLRPYLTREIHRPCFAPTEAVEQRNKSKAAKAPYSKWPSYQSRKRKPRPMADSYDRTTYARAIARICKDEKIPHWSPNQLRHAAATRLRSAFGLDVAQVVLGHSRADVTQLYAELDLKKAAAAMAKIG